MVIISFLIIVFGVQFILAAQSKANYEESENDIDNYEFIKIPAKNFWGIIQNGDFGINSFSTDIPTKELMISDSEATMLSSLFNCQKSQLNLVENYSILKGLNVKHLKTLKKFEVLYELSKINNLHLFELYAEHNLSTILSKISSLRDFHVIIFNCIRAKSLKTFLLALVDQIYPINAPRTLALAAMKGSKDILEYIIENSSNSQFKLTWEWKMIEDEDGNMLHLGRNPFAASLSLAASKAIKSNQFDCLLILASSGLDVSYRNFWLLKETGSCNDYRMFELLSEICVSIPISVLNEILILAIKNKNLSLIEHLFTLDVDLDVKSNLFSMIGSNTKNYSKISTACLNSNVISSETEFETPESLKKKLNFEHEKLNSHVQLSTTNNCEQDPFNDEYVDDSYNLCTIC